jgi:hypothetical protein
MMWGKNKLRDDVIFLDREPRLFYKPDIICEWKDISKHFPPDYFHCVVFDPPHFIGETTSYNKDPGVLSYGQKHQFGWYGCFKSRREAVVQLRHAQREISKVSSRVCLKWNDQFIPLNNVLALFENWIPQFIIKYHPRNGRGSNGHRKCDTWWVKLIRKSVLEGKS